LVTIDKIQSGELCALKRNKAMDNVQNCDIYINIPSSETNRSYLIQILRKTERKRERKKETPQLVSEPKRNTEQFGEAKSL
jgi:hypothetical protein